MNYSVGAYRLRCPEPMDIAALYEQKNDPGVAALLGGFTSGYSREDLAQWISFHRERRDEVLWVIADAETDRCVGHVGLYKVDHRVRSAEFAILIGDRAHWGKGAGRAISRAVLRYGFCELNLNRIELSVLSTNERAFALYRSLGFQVEGRLREAQYKQGQYIDVIMMGLLRSDYADGCE